MAKRRAIGPSAWIVGGAGVLIGVVAAALVEFGNPGNMGLCMACFTRDTVSVFGGEAMKMNAFAYIRPEILGIVVGAAGSALAFKEFRPRGGSSVVLRFVLGFIFMVAALVFLGCTVRAWLRLGGGDLNALVGVAGMVLGVAVGGWLLKRGFNLGRSKKLAGSTKALGWLSLALAVALLVLAFALASGLSVGSLTGVPKNAKKTAEGAVFTANDVVSPEGATMTGGGIIAEDGSIISDATSVEEAAGIPGGSRAPLVISLVAGLAVGVVAQRTRFCTIGGIRDVILVKRWDLFFGVLGVLVGVAVTAVALGNFKLGFEGQPAAHTVWAANFLALGVAALAAVQLGGCPLRQMVMSGEGDVDAFVAVLGMAAGAIFAHYFGVAATAAGVSSAAWVSLAAMGAFLLVLGFVRRVKA